MPLPSELQAFLENNGGTIKAAQANAIGISNERLRLFVDADELERAAHGVYISPDNFPDNNAMHKVGFRETIGINTIFNQSFFRLILQSIALYVNLSDTLEKIYCCRERKRRGKHMTDILGGNRFISIEPIEKGWSEDKKYCVTDTSGVKYLLRITPIERYEVRKSLFDMLEQVAALGIPMCLPIEFGTCAEGVYSLQSWIDGEDLEVVLPLLSETEQYVLGLKSSEILRKMHGIPAPDTQEEWAVRFNRKTNHKIKTYRECGIRFDGDDYIVDYIENNRYLLENRPQCFQHGDYHVGNMMMERSELKIIDFDRYDFGDPWEEFNRIVWCATASPHFATGQLRGYFGGEPPMEFFKLLAFYIASNTLSSIYWAIPFGQSDLDTMMKQSQDVLRWYDNMRSPVPSWYLSKYEIWDILDANGNKTGRFLERGKDMKAGEYHLAVHVWKHNGKGEWLINKRTLEKGGKWETTGGAAIAGEDSLTAALRETNEELGLALNPEKGTLFWQFAKQVSDEHRCLIDVWVFEHDCAIDDIYFQERETCEAIWVTAEQIRELMRDDKFFSDVDLYFDEMVDKWEVAI